MKYRKLGSSEANVSEIGFGAWGIGGKQWQGGQDDESLKALRRSFELGVNLVDTALAYGDGHSEQLVGQAVRSSFRKVHIATKIPPHESHLAGEGGHADCGSVSLRLHHSIDRTESCGTWAWSRFICSNSMFGPMLGRQTEEWRRAIEDLRRSGKVRYFGISITEHEPDSALEAIKTGLVNAVQVIYNIFDQSAEKNLFPLCQQMKVGVLARVPLDEGGLTGTITEQTVFEPGEFREAYFRGDRKRQVMEHVAALRRDLAQEPGTLAEIALRFCLSEQSGDFGDSGHAARRDGREQLPGFERGQAGRGDTGGFEEACLGSEFLSGRFAAICLMQATRLGRRWRAS